MIKIETVDDILTEYSINLDKKIKEKRDEIPLDEDMVKKYPNDKFFKWEECLKKDLLELEELKCLSIRLRNFIKNNWKEMQKIKIK